MQNQMEQQRLYILIAAIAGMLGTFLPWVNVPIIGSVAGTAGDGWITFILFGITAFITLRGDKKKELHKKELLAASIISGLTALFALWKIIDISTSMSRTVDKANPFSQMFASTVSAGIGLYIILLAGIAIIVIRLKMKGKVSEGK